VNAAKTTSERVAKLRADRDAMGLKRLELYAHPDDWPAIKTLAEKLQRKRTKMAAKRSLESYRCAPFATCPMPRCPECPDMGEPEAP